MNTSIIKHIDLIALQNIEGCGVATTRKICDYINERQICITMPTDLFRILPEMKDKKVIKAKLSNVSLFDIEEAYHQAKGIIERSLAREIGILSIYDSEYPEVLRSTIDENGKLDAPLLLYYKGNLAALSMPTIAIIGTREPNNDGIIAGRYFGKAFSESGFNIVSGLALGCDSCGHEGALEGKGITTAILAHGLDTIYPSQNKDLAENIINKGGLLLSEYPVGTQVSRFSLVARDRLQAGLALATLVIQTGVKGGTMHAANTTLLAGKALYTVMYKDMSAFQVQGNIALANRGAKFITSNDVQLVAADILKSLNNCHNTQATFFEPTLFSNIE